MADRRRTELDVGHPAPDRGRVGLGLLMFGILGGPAAWIVQLLAGAAIAGLACRPPGAAPSHQAGWGDPVAIGVNIGALLVAAAALGAAFAVLRKTEPAFGGGHDSVMEAGEGRSRFIGVWGVWTSLLFIAAIAFNTLSVFWSGLCGG